MTLTRRTFLRMLGLGTAAAAVPAVLVPERKMWFVPGNAPVGSRLEAVTVPLMRGVDWGTGDVTVYHQWDPRGHRMWVKGTPSPSGDSGSLFGIEPSPYPLWSVKTYRPNNLARRGSGSSSYRQLAVEYGVSEMTIWRVVRRLRWRHVADQPESTFSREGKDASESVAANG